MNSNFDLVQMFISSFTMHLPTLLVCVIAVIAIIANWQRLGSGAIWAALGFGIALLLCFAMPLGQAAIQVSIRQGEISSRHFLVSGLSLIWSVLRAATYVFLLLAIIMGRPRTAVQQ